DVLIQVCVCIRPEAKPTKARHVKGSCNSVANSGCFRGKPNSFHFPLDDYELSLKCKPTYNHFREGSVGAAGRHPEFVVPMPPHPRRPLFILPSGQGRSSPPGRCLN